MRPLTVQGIQRAVARYYGYGELDLSGGLRHGSLVRARQIAMWFIRRRLALSFPAIGAAFNRDHTTVIHGIRTIDEQRTRDLQVRAEMAAIEWKNFGGPTLAITRAQHLEGIEVSA